MSLSSRYYDFVYGGLIGHPKLSAHRWRRIIREARNASGLARCALRWFCAGVVGLFSGAGAATLLVMGLTTSHWAGTWFDSRLVGITWIWCAAIASIVMCNLANAIFTRASLKREIMAAAADRQIETSCLECGYSLRGLPSTSTACPECGAPCH